MDSNTRYEKKFIDGVTPNEPYSAWFKYNQNFNTISKNQTKNKLDTYEILLLFLGCVGVWMWGGGVRASGGKSNPQLLYIFKDSIK